MPVSEAPDAPSQPAKPPVHLDLAGRPLNGSTEPHADDGPSKPVALDLAGNPIVAPDDPDLMPSPHPRAAGLACLRMRCPHCRRAFSSCCHIPDQGQGLS